MGGTKRRCPGVTYMKLLRVTKNFKKAPPNESEWDEAGTHYKFPYPETVELKSGYEWYNKPLMNKWTPKLIFRRKLTSNRTLSGRLKQDVDFMDIDSWRVGGMEQLHSFLLYPYGATWDKNSYFIVIQDLVGVSEAVAWVFNSPVEMATTNQFVGTGGNRQPIWQYRVTLQMAYPPKEYT